MRTERQANIALKAAAMSVAERQKQIAIALAGRPGLSACLQNQCHSGRKECPSPMACEIPSDQAPALAKDIAWFWGTVLGAIGTAGGLVWWLVW
jgi:hypothetical protein